MKKTYINPETRIVMLSTVSHILAGSDMRVRGNYDSNTITMGARKGGSLWDDDDEEY